MAQEKMNLGRVLVIGGCGFLGHHIVNLLVSDYKAKVSVIDLRCSRNRRPASDGVTYVEADITDALRLVSVFEDLKPDIVIHTASPIPNGDQPNQKKLYQKVNVEGTRAVIEACHKTGVKALVYTSSASVISDNKADLINADERWPVVSGPKQTEYYTETKIQAEQLVLDANERGKLLTCSLRPSGIFGEADGLTTDNLVKVYQTGKSGVQLGGNENLFDFTYAVNVAHAHMLAAAALLVTSASKTQPLDHEKVDGEAFFITNDCPIYFWDFARAIWAAAGATHNTASAWRLPKEVAMWMGFCAEWSSWFLRKPALFSQQRVVFACMTRYYDITKAKQRLGYKPIVPLGEGIRRSVNYVLEKQKEGVKA